MAEVKGIGSPSRSPPSSSGVDEKVLEKYKLLFDEKYGKAFSREFIVGEEQRVLYGDPRIMAMRSKLIESMLDILAASGDESVLASKVKLSEAISGGGTINDVLTFVWIYLHMGVFNPSVTLPMILHMWDWVNYFQLDTDDFITDFKSKTIGRDSFLQVIGLAGITTSINSKEASLLNKIINYVVKNKKFTPQEFRHTLQRFRSSETGTNIRLDYVPVSYGPGPGFGSIPAPTAIVRRPTLGNIQDVAEDLKEYGWGLSSLNHRIPTDVPGISNTYPVFIKSSGGGSYYLVLNVDSDTVDLNEIGKWNFPMTVTRQSVAAPYPPPSIKPIGEPQQQQQFVPQSQSRGTISGASPFGIYNAPPATQFQPPGQQSQFSQFSAAPISQFQQQQSQFSQFSAAPTGSQFQPQQQSQFGAPTSQFSQQSPFGYYPSASSQQ